MGTFGNSVAAFRIGGFRVSGTAVLRFLSVVVAGSNSGTLCNSVLLWVTFLSLQKVWFFVVV